MASIRTVVCAAMLLIAAPASAATITLEFMCHGRSWLHVTLTEVVNGLWIDADVPPLPGEWSFDSLWFENGITYTGQEPVFHPGVWLVLFYDRPAFARFTRPCPPCEGEETLGPPIPPKPCEKVLQATPHFDAPEPGVLALLGVAGCLAIGRRRRMRVGGRRQARSRDQAG